MLRKLSFFSTTAAATAAGRTQNPNPKPHFITEYLITSCGFPQNKAIEASKLLHRIESPQQPNSVLNFFRTHGFNDTEIKKLVFWNPKWLSLDVDKILRPKFESLQNLGFLKSDLTNLILSNPVVINHQFNRTVLPKIELWRTLLGSDQLLMNVLKRKRWIFGYSIAKRIQPNLQFLEDCGIPESRITMVIRKHPDFILQKPDSIRALVHRVEDLGIPRSSGLFLWALWALYLISPAKFKAQSELVKSFGWSESEFLSAFRKAPVFLTGSVETMRRKMEFLVKQVGCEPGYVAFNPVLLTLSMENRLVPRHRVLEVLKTRELVHGVYNVRSVMCCTEKKFVKNYVVRHKEEVPELLELYVGWCRRRDAL